MTTTRRGDAAIGAVCGAVAAVVATFVAAPEVVLLDEWRRTSASALVHVPTIGLVGLVYVGWLTVPIGGALGSMVGVLAGQRLVTPSGLFPTMAIGALAVGSAWLIASGFDAVSMAVAVGALPGTLGGAAAWWVGRRITRRRGRASGVGMGGADGAGGEDGG